jgi:monoamine oxidase
MIMKSCDVLVIGAGAAGLMVAYKLSAAGRKVMVLEARGRLGGRIDTKQTGLFSSEVELGAEFIHGNLPVTLNLLKAAGIEVQPASGAMWRYNDGKFTTDEDTMPEWETMLAKLEQLQEDCSIEAFLQQEFGDDRYAALRQTVRDFVSGYDTADPNEASAFALRKEWQHEDENAQPRVKGGYIGLINFLADECKRSDGEIFLNSMVKDIYHEPGNVKITTTTGDVFTAGKLVIALPLGVLQNHIGEGAINFYPPIAKYLDAFADLGFGAIIKVLLEFDTAFWEEKDIRTLIGTDPKEMGFVLSDQPVPTWWTQQPEQGTLLTGWLGGPAAAAKQHATEDELLEMALKSLATIFNKDAGWLRTRLVASSCVNWTADPFTRGSYAYDKVASPAARQILGQPINQTLYFTGEYLYEGPAMGTVEAALTSGENVANKIIGTE